MGLDVEGTIAAELLQQWLRRAEEVRRRTSSSGKLKRVLQLGSRRWRAGFTGRLLVKDGEGAEGLADGGVLGEGITQSTQGVDPPSRKLGGYRGEVAPEVEGSVEVGGVVP